MAFNFEINNFKYKIESLTSNKLPSIEHFQQTDHDFIRGAKFNIKKIFKNY